MNDSERVSQAEQVLADTLRQVSDPDHAEICAARAELAAAYSSTGRHHEAVPLLEQVVADSITIYGSHEPETRTAKANLAYSYWVAELGPWSAAETIG